MAHNISFFLPEVELGKVDANFIIKKNKVTLGELKISKGGLDYRPSKKQNAIKLTWTQFDDIIRKFDSGE